MPEEHIDWWHLPVEEQKRAIEAGLDWFLSQNSHLTPMQKHLLWAVISFARRGLFGLAAAALHDLGLPESAWAPSALARPIEVEGITRETLMESLHALRATPAQEPPVFC